MTSEGQTIRDLAIATDTALAALYGEATVLAHHISADRKHAAFLATRLYTSQRELDEYEARIAEKVNRLTDVKIAMRPLEALFNEHKWTRAFLVITSGKGHVHRSMSCSTCYPTTVFDWRPEYSGADEAQIVEDAGERACTVCYPSAPVEVLARPSRIFSDDERAAMKTREERAAAKIARDAKRAAKAATKDGSPLKVVEVHVGADGVAHEYRREITTEITAVGDYIRATMLLGYEKNEITRAATQRMLAQIETALADKHGVTIEQERARLAAKVAAKAKKEGWR